MLAYMASGVPVVVSPVGMNSDVLAQSEVGFGASTSEEWVESLSALLADTDLASRFGAQGRRLAEERYSVERVSDGLAAAIRSVRT